MTSPAQALDHPATLADLEALPEHVKGEIIDGVLYTQPRPRFRHGLARTSLAHQIGGPCGFDPSGPGGWWILVEPGIELPGAPEVAPDLAGWRRERLEVPGDEEPIRVVPDWICEVLSRSNRRYDRRTKFPFYARVGVPYLWVVDPEARTLEIKKLIGGRWNDMAVFADDELVRAEPFEGIEVRLADLWPG